MITILQLQLHLWWRMARHLVEQRTTDKDRANAPVTQQNKLIISAIQPQEANKSIDSIHRNLLVRTHDAFIAARCSDRSGWAYSQGAGVARFMRWLRCLPCRRQPLSVGQGAQCCHSPFARSAQCASFARVAPTSPCCNALALLPRQNLYRPISSSKAAEALASSCRARRQHFRSCGAILPQLFT